MGGGKVKRRFIDVWAWRGVGEHWVRVSQRKPKWRDGGFDGYWYNHNSTSLCPAVFNKLTGVKASKAKGMAPVRIRVPAWTVLKGDDDE